MTDRPKFDLAVIGAGPGGYVAAIRAAQLGQSVALIERNLIGGCCLNDGCIPTKTLLRYAAALYAVRDAQRFGISVGTPSFDFAAMIEKKNQIIARIRSSLEQLIRSNKITIYRGSAAFQSPKELTIVGTDSLLLQAEQIIIATGSTPQKLSFCPADSSLVVDSTALLERKELPRHLCIIGGGVIGCEFASLYADFGVKVTIVEAFPSLLSSFDPSIAQMITQSFQARGITIESHTRVQRIEPKSHSVIVGLHEKADIECDCVLVAVGRTIITESLQLDRIGLRVNAHGAIDTNEKMQTEVPGIYAIGDVTGRFMLAHTASHQGIVAASNAAGHSLSMDYHAIPAVLFTRPEAALVGLTLEQALAAGHLAQKSLFPLSALGTTQTTQDLQGFFQIVFHSDTGQIIGAQVVGPKASELIAEMALAIKNQLPISSLLKTIHAHPTFSEGWFEAAALASGLPIHTLPRKSR